MTDIEKKYKENCIRMYDENVERYVHTYTKEYSGYPGNQKRLHIIRDLVRYHKPERILYVGCGACIPLVTLIKEFKCQIEGIDFSKKMVQRGREVLKEHGLDPELVQIGDIEEINTLPRGLFDFAIVAGVFTHLLDDSKAMENLNHKLKKGGILAAEFRNELFSCYSFNRFSYDFFLNTLLDGIDFSQDIKIQIENYFKDRCEIPLNEEIAQKSAHLNGNIIKKFHNPLNIDVMLKTWGFSLKKNYFYHFHVLPPSFHSMNPELYHKLSLFLENPLDWRGNLMASAFVTEAKKIQSNFPPS